MNIFIDFETFYDSTAGLSVSTMGNRNYAKAADAYIVSIVHDRAAWVGEIGDKTGPQFKLNFSYDQPIAVNSNFDESFWNKHFPQFRLPWHCLLDQARVAQLPGHLAGLSKVIQGKAVDKTIRDEMDGVRWDTLSEERQNEVAKYCLNDSVEAQAIHGKIPVMSDFENNLALQTRRINKRGVAVNLEAVDKAVTGLRAVLHNALSKIPWVRGGDAPLSYPSFSAYCASQNVVPPESLAKGDMDCVQWVKNNPKHAPVLIAMREYRNANTIVKKLLALKSRVGEDNTMPIELIYCGAYHTRRWSCRGFTMQNMDKAPVQFTLVPEGYTLPGDTAPWTGTVWTRPFIVPRPGKKFVILDLSQIEPRCLWWLVGDQKMLDLARGGYGAYEAHARASMGWTGGNLKKENDRLYRTAKARTLGAGYGAGGEKFQTVAKTMADLDLTLEESKAAVESFRRSNPKIVAFWRMFDDKIAASAVKREDLEIEMPTGELLKHLLVTRYVDPKRRGGAFKSYTCKGEPKEQSFGLWGGVLTENTCQRMARDILGYHMLLIEEAGIDIAFSSHDEVIMEVDAGTAPEAFKLATAIMSTPPPWCADLPLACEGGIFDHYTK